MPKGTTITQVAALAGVSVITASRAVRGVGYVAKETRDKVLAAAEQINYSPNVLAQRMRGVKSRLIGVLVHGFVSSVLHELVSHIDQAANRLGYALLVFNAPSFDAPDRAGTTEVLRSLCDGLLLVMPNTHDTVLDKLERDQSPCVLINFAARDIQLPVVIGANSGAARLAVEHLLALGHRRIAFIGGTTDTGQSAERQRGYLEALQAAGIAPPADYIGAGNFTHPSGYREARRMLALAQRPTAIFAANDDMAFGALDAAQECGLRVPADLSVVGHDDVAQSGCVFPRLTTVRQPLPEIASRAVAELVGIIDGRPLLAARLELPATLVVRDSTALAPGL
jgi:LacI family transcriptional regulator